MLATTAPYQQYFDTDGSPLDSGYVYYGTAELNPETNPITVYWDAAGTAPAAQPVRTLNGYTVRNGTPTAIYASTDYSQTVKNSRGATVVYSPRPSSAYNLSYSVSETYPAGTIGAKLRESISVKDAPFNAKGDGTTDDTAAVQAASTYAALNGRALYFPAGTYKLMAKINVSGNVSIWGEARGTTKLYWPSTAPSSGIGIALNSESGFSQTCDITSISLVTGSTVAAGDALAVTGALDTAADRITPRVVVRDVTFRGLTNPSIDGWASAMHFINCSNVVVDSCAVFGKVSGSGEPDYDSLYCIIYDSSNGATPHAVAIAITNNFFNYAKVGIYCSDFEGAMICDNQIVGVNTGISVTGPLTYPHAAIMNNHINASLLCVSIERMYEVFVHGNLLYKQLDDTATGTGIEVKTAAAYFSILGNTFENLNDVVAMNAIVVTSGSRGLVDDNIFRRCNNQPGTVPGTGIWLTAGSAECVVGTNLFVETTNQIIDSGTLNNVKRSSPAATVDNWYSTDTDGRTRQWGTTVIALNASGFGTITLAKTYRSAQEMAIVSNGDSSVHGEKAFSVATLGIGSISFSVQPNPGAVSVRVNYVSNGI